jgi:hypothetical protein
MFRTMIILAGMTSLGAALPAILPGAAPPAMAAETNIIPLPPSDCGAVSAAVSRAINIPLKTRVATPSFPDGLHGDACLLSGQASGLTILFDRAQDKIAAALTDWRHLEALDADGPGSTNKAFARGPQRFVYDLSMDPPPGTCSGNKPITACKVPLRRWVWSFKAVGFVE